MACKLLAGVGLSFVIEKSVLWQVITVNQRRGVFIEWALGYYLGIYLARAKW